jgi:hypothetical protein
MRKILFAIICGMITLSGSAQSIQENVNTKPLLFETFINGVVLMKSGAVEQSPLNYNTDNQSVVFIKDEKYMVLDDLDNIDTIYIQQKKFVPVNNAIYQVVSQDGPVALLLSFSNKIQPLISTADHNGSSKQAQSQVSNTVTDSYTTKLFRGNYSVEIHRHYWFKKNDKLYRVTPKRQFVNSFTSKARNTVENYIAAENINFDYEPDLIKLVAFCNKELQ